MMSVVMSKNSTLNTHWEISQKNLANVGEKLMKLLRLTMQPWQKKTKPATKG